VLEDHSRCASERLDFGQMMFNDFSSVWEELMKLVLEKMGKNTKTGICK